MVLKVTPRELELLAPAGYYIALRIGFAFPLEETNALPERWTDHYTKNMLMIHDPLVQWAYTNTGFIRWSDLKQNDLKGVLKSAATFGLRFGLSVAIFDDKIDSDGKRSYANFARSDREFNDLEAKLLHTFVGRRHREMLAPTNLTAAEIEALAMVKNGLRLKGIALELGITEGAVKQRLKNAKDKLGARNSAQAAAMARQFKLI